MLFSKVTERDPESPELHPALSEKELGRARHEFRRQVFLIIKSAAAKGCHVFHLFFRA